MPTNKEGYMKSYYQKNHDILLGRMSERIECRSCGDYITRGNMSAHVKTKTCQLKNEIRKIKMIDIINTFKDMEYIEKYKHDEFKNANTKLQSETY